MASTMAQAEPVQLAATIGGRESGEKPWPGTKVAYVPLRGAGASATQKSDESDSRRLRDVARSDSRSDDAIRVISYSRLCLLICLSDYRG